MTYTNPRPATPVVTVEQMYDQLHLIGAEDCQYIADSIDACTDYAENALGTSLLNRTITAKYFRNRNALFPYAGWFTWNQLYLPRGPIQSITNVVDANDVALTGWELEGFGNIDVLLIHQAYESPLTVTYVAGYGTDPCNCPADIRMGIRTHVASLYEQRASTDEKQITAVPHSLEAFYSLRRRSCPVG